MLVKEAAELHGISYYTLRCRIIRGETPDEAVRQDIIRSKGGRHSHEDTMRHARAALADLQHKRRDILTLRETMAFGGQR